MSLTLLWCAHNNNILHQLIRKIAYGETTTMKNKTNKKTRQTVSKPEEQKKKTTHTYIIYIYMYNIMEY